MTLDLFLTENIWRTLISAYEDCLLHVFLNLLVFHDLFSSFRSCFFQDGVDAIVEVLSALTFDNLFQVL